MSLKFKQQMTAFGPVLKAEKGELRLELFLPDMDRLHVIGDDAAMEDFSVSEDGETQWENATYGGITKHWTAEDWQEIEDAIRIARVEYAKE